MKFVNRLVKELELEYVALIMSAVQKLGSWCFQEESGLRHLCVTRMFKSGKGVGKRALG